MPKVSGLFAGACAVAWASFQIACTPSGGGAGTPTMPIDPTCTILGISSLKNNTIDSPTWSRRSPTDPSAIGGFTRFSSVGHSGNPAVAGNPDAYGISEAWLRPVANATVVRAQAHGAPRQGATDKLGSAWSMIAQDATGAWSPVFAAGTANRGNELDAPDTGALTVPQLMTVGTGTPQMFACAGLRTEDDTARSTWLIEIFPPNSAAGGASGGAARVQDMLYGDDRFVPNARGGPLVGPANPSSPRVSGPGDQARDGHAMQSVLHNATEFTGWTGNCTGPGGCLVQLLAPGPAIIWVNASVVANFRIHVNTSIPPAMLCPTAPLIARQRWVAQPNCGSPPPLGATLQCDAQGYFCCGASGATVLFRRCEVAIESHL